MPVPVVRGSLTGLDLWFVGIIAGVRPPCGSLADDESDITALLSNFSQLPAYTADNLRNKVSLTIQMFDCLTHPSGSAAVRKQTECSDEQQLWNRSSSVNDNSLSTQLLESKCYGDDT